MEIHRHMSRISEVLYVGLCDIIGTPTQVKIRQDVMDTVEMINQHEHSYSEVRRMESGSTREGFRLRTSDIDTMFWFDSDIVICNLSQVPPYHSPPQTLILNECHDTPPGFAKLRLLTSTNNQRIRVSSVSVNDQMYISSSLYRELWHACNLACNQSFPKIQSASLHGPCLNGFLGNLECDLAFCFHCKYWPLPANQWIERCKRHGWPSPKVVQDIISDGCHLVAISSGRSTSTQQCETEWRMSFSHAEYKLVYSMNHTQFLCYGVLKIFLKEVLNVGLEDPFLCSYFMKTTLFWKIQENTISRWYSKNILQCAWLCFKYLCQCVYKGDFPNFFIPQNNMFINKIHGVAQKQLFLQLLTLYNMGFSCLLLSPSLHKILEKAILNPHLHVRTEETNIISEFELDLELYREILYKRGIVKSKPFLCLMTIDYLDYLNETVQQFSQNHINALHIMRNVSLIRHAFCLDKSREDNINPTNNCRPLDMLISAAESGCISDTLYVVMYLYNKSRYTEALYYIDRTKQKLSQPYILYYCTGNANRERYMEATEGQPLINKVRKAVSCEIDIDPICCIDEIRLEVCVSEQNGIPWITVPPLVMTHMLSFLCHHHLGDCLRSRQSLGDLQTLLRYDDGQLIISKYRDISWQILGVCEHIHGDKERALYSYRQSYIQFPLHQINLASLIRMQNIIQNMYL